MGPGGERVVAYLGFMRTRILEELAFLNGSTLLGALHSGGGGSYIAGASATPLCMCMCAAPEIMCMLAAAPGGGGGAPDILRFSVTGVLATNSTNKRLYRVGSDRE